MFSAFIISFIIHVNSYNNNPLPFLWAKGATYMAIMGDSTNAEYGHVALEAENNYDGATEYWSSDQLQPGQTYTIKMSFDAGAAKMWINGKAQVLHIIYPWVGTWRDYASYPLIIGRRPGHDDRNFDGTVTNVVAKPKAWAGKIQY